MGKNNLTASNLKNKLSGLQGSIPDEVALRLHRSVSWIARAEKSQSDKDAKFIFLWIAFNAAYASDRMRPDTMLIAAKASEKEAQNDFFTKVVHLDNARLIYDTIWERFPGPVRMLMKNQYIYDPFWKGKQDSQGNETWQQSFEGSNTYFKNAFAKGNTEGVLRLIFSRLYTLRNQMIHGGTTWSSSINRNQVRDGVEILACLVPLLVHIMMNNAMEDWGTPPYPPVDRDTGAL